MLTVFKRLPVYGSLRGVNVRPAIQSLHVSSSSLSPIIPSRSYASSRKVVEEGEIINPPKNNANKKDKNSIIKNENNNNNKKHDFGMFEVLALTLHDLLESPEMNHNRVENDFFIAVQLIAPRFYNNYGTTQLPLYNDVYFGQIETEMNELIFKIQRDIIQYNRWIITARPASFDSINIALLPYADNKYAMYDQYHQEFVNGFFERHSTPGDKLAVNRRNPEMENILAQAKKGNRPKMAEVGTIPGTQLVKRAPVQPPARSITAEQDILYNLSNTIEAKGHAMVGDFMNNAIDQGCDVVYIDHGQRHSLRLELEQMEALMDNGHSMFVEQLIAKNDILDLQFLHFQFVVLMNKHARTRTGKPTISTVSHQGKIYLRVFTHFMWAVQHIQFDKKLKEKEKEKEKGGKKKAEVIPEPTMEELEVQKGKLRKILKKDQDLKQQAENNKKEEKESKEEEEEDEVPEDQKMYTCTRLTGYNLLKLIQKQPKELNGGIVINYGVDPKMCDVANKVIITTEDILEMELDQAMQNEPVERPYQN